MGTCSSVACIVFRYLAQFQVKCAVLCGFLKPLKMQNVSNCYHIIERKRIFDIVL